MKPIEEGLDALSRAVQGEAKAEAERILAEAKAKADKTQQRAQEQVQAQRAEIMNKATQEASRIRGQAIATTQLKARTQQLEQREKLLNSTFKAVQDKLATIPQWKDYPQIAQKLLREALVHLGAPAARISTDEQTRACLTDDVVAALAQELNVKLEFGPPLKQGTGVVVETPDGHRTYDNTLEFRSSRMQTALRARVYRLLMGESL
jgi:vacuolar-type H+-ATPase subunit E/Vma4